MSHTRERHIDFLPQFIPALLDGRKTQTRRVIKPQPVEVAGKLFQAGKAHLVAGRYDGAELKPLRCPYGQPGDRLRVKLAAKDTCPCCGYTPKDRRLHMDHYLCRASRITLEITDVRVERVQEITMADAQAEGIRINSCQQELRASDAIALIQFGFRKTWDEIYGPGAWERNDWVWAIIFRRIV